MKLIDILIEKLGDMRHSPLYHMTSFENALLIMDSDMLIGTPPNLTLVVKDKELGYGDKDSIWQISFTRNKSWNPHPSSLSPGAGSINNLDVKFVVDKDRLKTKYRVVPFDYSGLMSTPWDRNTQEYKDFFDDDNEPEDMPDIERDDEYEERVIGEKIINLHKYVTDIIYKGNNPEVQQAINNYLHKWRIKPQK